jgi:hypothetical protein
MFACFFSRKSKKQKPFTRTQRRRQTPLSFERLELRDVPSVTIVDFEDLSLAPNSYWNGSDGSAGFISRGTSFNNSFDQTFGSWSGWSYSNVNDTRAAGTTNQYAAYTGTGVGGSGNYAVAYCSDPAFGGVLPTISIPDGMQVQSALFTNTTNAALSMLNGDQFAKKFGPSDWFDLTITGKDAGNHALGTVEFYLAQNGSLVSTWQSVNLSSLSAAKTLVFSLTSSDTGAFGMNTPAYFAMDDITLVPKVTTVVSASSATVVYGNPITFTATLTAAGGSAAPTAGSVNFKDTTTGKDLGNGSFVVGAGTSSTATITVPANNANLFNVSAGDNIVATYIPGNGFTGSAGTTTVAITGKYAISLVGGNTITAGSSFLFTVQAADAFGNPLPSYNGPTSVLINTSPSDPQGSFPLNGVLQSPSTGFGFFQGSLNSAGTYTLTATAGLYSGTSSSLTVIPSDAVYFTVTAPTAATTGSAVHVTVTAFDHFGNVATGYTGTVKLTSTDPGAANVAGSYTFTTGAGKDNGIHTVSVTLLTPGSQVITATDTTSTNPTITGSSSSITSRGLTVSSFTPTATGFTVTFSEPFTVADVNLYGGSQASPLQDVTLVGTASGPVNGSFVIDPSGTSATFKASSIFLSTFFQSFVLPDDTWTATLVSGTGAGATAHGFFGALNAPLDGGNNAGHDNYTTSFTTANSSKEALSIPDFARGPDGANSIKVPNDSAKGIPVTLSNVPAALGVTDVVFTLTYNPTLPLPTAGGTGDSSGTGSTFVMGTPVSVDATHSTVTFTWHNAAAQSGTVVLGDILANVPNSAANEYKSKEILGLSSIKVNGADFTGVWASGLHVNTYFGDVTGDGKITGLDVATAGAVAGGSSEGLSAFRLVDPAVVGDIAGDASIDATAVSDLASFTSNLPTPQIPAIPTGLTITPGGPDPTLSLGEPQRQEDKEKGRQGENSTPLGLLVSLSPGVVVSVPVLLDDPHPEGSTGMEEAVLALTYDPKVLTVSSSDITLGAIPSLGIGWHLVSVVDQATGQIGIDLYSTTAITSSQAGSLVNIIFHIMPGPSAPATVVQLVSAVAPQGQWFTTEVADSEGQFVLTPGLDRLMIQTSVSRASLAAHSARNTVRGAEGRSRSMHMNEASFATAPCHSMDN